MAKGLVCARTNTKNYQSLDSRVGSDMAQAIWNATDGNIGINGLPIGDSINKLSPEMVKSINDSRVAEAIKLTNNLTATDKSMRERVFGGKSSTTINESLSAISKKNPYIKKLISGMRLALQSSSVGAIVKISPSNYIPLSNRTEYTSSKAIYSPAYNIIYVPEFGDYSHNKNGMADESILQSISHSIFHNFIDSNPNSDTAMQLELLYDHVVGHIANSTGESVDNIKANSLGLGSSSEFISELFTNQSFSRLLYGIPSGPQNVAGDNAAYQAAKIISNTFGDSLESIVDNVLPSLKLVSYEKQAIEESMSPEQSMIVRAGNLVAGFEYSGYGNYELRSRSEDDTNIDEEAALSAGFSVEKSTTVDSKGGVEHIVTLVSPGYQAMNTDRIDIASMGDQFYIVNDYRIQNSNGDVITSEEFDAGQGAIIRQMNEHVLAGDSKVKASTVFAGARNGLIARQNVLSQMYKSGKDMNGGDLSKEQKEELRRQWYGIERILDGRAWDAICRVTSDKLSAYGVSTVIRSETISIGQADVTGDDVDLSEDLEAGGETGVLSNNNWADEAMFSISETGTSTSAVKLMMWSLRDYTVSSLGFPRVVDPEESYRSVLNLISSLRIKGINQLINAIEQEGLAMREAGIDNNIFMQLHSFLSKKASQQTKIQFAIAMGLHRNSFILNIFDRLNKLTTFDSNRGRADQVILNEWKTILKAKLLRGQNESIQRAMQTLKNAIDMATMLRDPKSKYPRSQQQSMREAIEMSLIESFRQLGIPISENTKKELITDRIYKKSLRNSGYTFNSSGFLSQFLFNKFNETTNTFEPAGVFSALWKTLRDASISGTSAQVESLLDDNAIRYLAKIEAKHSRKYFSNMSSDVDGNHRYGYGIQTHMTRTEDKLFSDKEFVRDLKTSTFSRFATWLGNDSFGATLAGATSDFMDSFRIAYRGGLKSNMSKKKATLRKKESIAEDLYSRIINFANNGQQTMFIDDSTKSDKHVSPIFVLKRRTISNKDNAFSVVVDDNGVKSYGFQHDASGLFRDAMQGVYAEADRILSINDVKNADGSINKDASDKLGANYANNGQYFYFYKFLNDFFKFDKDLNMDLDAMIVIDGKKVKTVDVLRNPQMLDNIVASYFNSLIEKNIEELERNKLITYKMSKDGSTRNMAKAPVPAAYAKEILKINILRASELNEDAKVINSEALEKAMRLLLLDMQLNSQIALQNSVMLFSGDYANNENNIKDSIRSVRAKMAEHGITDDGARSIKLAIDNAMDEYQKRLASDIAPGISPVKDLSAKGNMLSKTYNVIFTKDFKTDGKKYLKSISDVVGSQFSVKHLIQKGSDALELVSVQHKLESMYRYGLISEDRFVSILSKYNSGKDLSVEDMKTLFIGTGKPVQIGTKFVEVNGRKFAKKIYIKSAEMPLVRQVTQAIGTDYENLRLAMEASRMSGNPIDRVVHVSAAKMKSGPTVDIYQENGTIKSADELKRMFKDVNNQTQLDWDMFSYQQDLAPDLEEGIVSMSTQADKGVMAGVLDFEFDFNRSSNKSVTGSQMGIIKDQIQMSISAINEDKLDSELGLNNGSNSVSRSNVLRFLKSVAPKLKWRKSELMHSANILKSNIPVIFSPIGQKIESLIYSQFTNRVIKHDKTGSSLVQYPLPIEGKKGYSAGTNAQISKAMNNGAIMVAPTEDGRGYDPNTGLKYSMSEDGNVAFMQIVVPFKFFHNNRQIDLNKYKDKETGFIDLSKLDKKLLNIVGLRIPNQGHSSQIMCEIVGFMPEMMGDICLVHPNIVIQMGSDFDIDKLYTYWRNGLMTSNGNIHSIPDDFVRFDENQKIDIDYRGIHEWINENFGDVNESERPTVDEVLMKALNDAYFDVFSSILSHKDVIKKSMLLLDNPDLKELASEVFDPNGKGEFGDPFRQASDYAAQSSAKLGVGVFSSIMTSFTKMQGKGMGFIVRTDKGSASKPDYFKKFKDSNGNKLLLWKLDPNSKSIYIDKDGNENKRTSLKNIVIQQSGALDNAKEHVLHPNGINSETFGISATLSAMSDDNGNSLDLSVNARFLRQAGIAMLIDRIMSMRSITSSSEDYNKARIADVAPIIIAEIAAGDKKVMDLADSYRDDSYSSDDLLTIERMDRSSIEYRARQIDMIRTLVDLSKRSFRFSKVLSSIGTDSKGAQISYWANESKLNNYAVIDGNNIANAKKMYSYNGTSSVERIDGEHEMTNIGDLDASGNNLRILIKAQKIVGDLMGYTTDQFRSAIKFIEGQRGFITDNISSAKLDLRRAASAGFVSFAYSKIPLIKGLTLNTFVKDANISGRLIDLKNQKDLATNYYVQSLRVASDNKHIFINSRIKDGSLSDDIIRGFNDLYYSENKAYHDFAVDMVKYEILAGATHNPTSTIKYIDPDVFEELGVYNQLERVLNSELSHNEFAYKFFSNNPEEATLVWNYSSWKRDYHSIDENKNEYLRFPTTVVRQANAGKFSSGEKLIKIFNQITTEGELEKKVYKQFIQVKDKYGPSMLYAFNGVKGGEGEKVIEYIRVITKGEDRTTMDRVYNDYSDPFTYKPQVNLEIAHEIISEDEVAGYPVASGTMMDEAKAIEHLNSFKSAIPGSSTIGDLTSWLLSRNRHIDRFYADVIVNLPTDIANTKIIWGDLDGDTGAAYNSHSNTITISEKNALSAVKSLGAQYVHGMIMHEIHHAIISKAYKAGSLIDVAKSDSEKNFKLFYDGINNLHFEFIRNISDLPIVDAVTGKNINSRNSKFKYGYITSRLSSQGSTKTRTEELSKIVNELYPGNTEKDKIGRAQLMSSTYFLVSPKEFLAEMWSRGGIQKLGSSVMISEETQKLMRLDKTEHVTQNFFKLIARLFTKISKIFNSMYNEDGEINALQATFISTMDAINLSATPRENTASIGVPVITPDDRLRAFDFGNYAGQSQTEGKVKMINRMIIQSPEVQINNGESFNSFSSRIMNVITEAIENAQDNAVIVTHNTAYGLIKLWDESGRPEVLDKQFRIKYTKMDSAPGNHFSIKSKNGTILIVRHGETDDNIKGNFRGENTKLTKNGVRQSMELFEVIKNPSQIISSSLGRALATSNIIANGEEKMAPEVRANSKNSLELGSTIAEHLRNMDKTSRFAFRKSIENNIFKTECN